MVQLTRPLLKYIPDWYNLKPHNSSYFRKQALIHMMRYFKGRAWSGIKNARNRYFYHLKAEQMFASRESQARRDINKARIAAACEEHGYKYQYFCPTLTKLSIHLNLSMLARLAIYEPKTFKTLVDIAKEATSEPLLPANFSPSTILSKTDMPREFKPRPSIRR